MVSLPSFPCKDSVLPVLDFSMKKVKFLLLIRRHFLCDDKFLVLYKTLV